MTNQSRYSLIGQRVLITQADLFMGPAIASSFEQAGATVLTDNGDYEHDPLEPARVVAQAGRVDILIVNLRGTPRGPMDAPKSDLPAPSDISHTPAHLATEEDWQSMFNRLVHPTRRFIAAVLPQMIARKAGKIIVLSSGLSLRAAAGKSTYSTARAAQNAYVRFAGVDAAPHNVQINAIAQNFTKGGPVYTEQAWANPEIRDRVQREVPAGRLAEAREQAAVVLFLASQDSGFITGQVLPFTGGWDVS